MYLKLDRKDLKKTETNRPLNEIEFEHLNEDVQIGVMIIGSARIYSGNRYKKIFAPQADFVYQGKNYKVDITQRKTSTDTIRLPDGTELIAFWNETTPSTINHVIPVQCSNGPCQTALKATEVT